MRLDCAPLVSVWQYLATAKSPALCRLPLQELILAETVEQQ